jgi:septal ring factor EnvC (AmiA/AmiB activator)
MNEEQFLEIVSKLESEIHNLKNELEDCQDQNYELRCQVSNLEWRIEGLEK